MSSRQRASIIDATIQGKYYSASYIVGHAKSCECDLPVFLTGDQVFESFDDARIAAERRVVARGDGKFFIYRLVAVSEMEQREEPMTRVVAGI